MRPPVWFMVGGASAWLLGALVWQVGGKGPVSAGDLYFQAALWAVIALMYRIGGSR